MIWAGAWASAWQSVWSAMSGGTPATVARPPRGVLEASGYAPTITATEDGAPIAIASGAIEATGYAPTVSATQSASDVGVIAHLAGLLRRQFRRGTVARVTAQPASLRWEAFAPAVAASTTSRITPRSTGVEAVGFAPVVPRTTTAPAARVGVVGHAPTVQRPVTVQPGGGVVSGIAYAPSVHASTAASADGWTEADDEDDVEALLLLVGAAF